MNKDYFIAPYNYTRLPSAKIISFRLVQLYATNLVFWDSEGVWVCPSACPNHRECPKVGYLECLCDVITAHGAGTFNQDVCALTSFPRCLQKVIQPPTELVGW